LREDYVIGDIYNTQYVCQTGYQAKKIAARLWKEVQEHTNIAFLDEEPDPTFTAHLRTILEMTLMRRYDVVRGRVDPAGDDGAFFPIKGQTEQQQKNEVLIQLLAGTGVRNSGFTHIERGCCRGGIQEVHFVCFTIPTRNSIQTGGFGREAR